MASKNTCSVCLNNFTKPKLLPCFHTFCQQCIDDLIKAKAHFNMFNCPTCRQQTEVPSGGASQFVTNFYLEDDENDKQCCTKHKKEEVKVYCRDCRSPCCSVCVMVDHKDHTLADLDKVDQEMREIVMKLKTESEKKIKQLQEHSDFLKTNISDMNNLCKTACDKVQKQVDNICEKVKQIGGTIKDDIIKIGEDENSKLFKLVEDVDKMTSTMKEWCEYSDRILQHECIITTADRCGLEDIHIKTDYNIKTHLHQPAVRHPYYSMVEVDLDCLKRLLRKVQTSTLDGKQVLREQTSTTVGGNQLLRDIQTPTPFTRRFDRRIVSRDRYWYSDVEIIQGLPWCVRVKCDSSGLVNIYLILKEIEDRTIKSITANCTLKLLNIKDESKSLVGQGTRRFEKRRNFIGNIYRMLFDVHSMYMVDIDWYKLRGVNNGYVDDNNTFTVEATVHITEILLE